MNHSSFPSAPSHQVPSHLPFHASMALNQQQQQQQQQLPQWPTAVHDNHTLPSSKPYPPPRKERRNRKLPHELLSEDQKKANHIASEQKRRQNIRIGFDQLIDMVPTLNHGNRSEALILQQSVDHIKYLVAVKNELKNQVRELQGALGDTNYEEDSSEDELMYGY